MGMPTSSAMRGSGGSVTACARAAAASKRSEAARTLGETASARAAALSASSGCASGAMSAVAVAVDAMRGVFAAQLTHRAHVMKRALFTIGATVAMRTAVCSD